MKLSYVLTVMLAATLVIAQTTGNTQADQLLKAKNITLEHPINAGVLKQEHGDNKPPTLRGGVYKIDFNGDGVNEKLEFFRPETTYGLQDIASGKSKPAEPCMLRISNSKGKDIYEDTNEETLKAMRRHEDVGGDPTPFSAIWIKGKAVIGLINSYPPSNRAQKQRFVVIGWSPKYRCLYQMGYRDTKKSFRPSDLISGKIKTVEF